MVMRTSVNKRATMIMVLTTMMVLTLDRSLMLTLPQLGVADRCCNDGSANSP
jgi:hypothetical protein